MWSNIQEIDQYLFTAINQFQGGVLDGFFVGMSNKYNWIALYLILLLFFAWQRGWKKALIFLGLTVSMVAAADLLSVHAFKNVFERLRPCHNPDLVGLVKIINNKCGGQFGFVSSHAANHFALAQWFVLVFGKKFNWYKCPFWIWAILIAISRVYLGVHYLGDVIVGAILGILLAQIAWYFYHKKLNWI